MSRGALELVHRLYDEDGPFSLPLSPDEEALLLDRHFRDFYVEQIEVRMPADYPEGEQVLVGRRGMAEVIALLRDSWTAWRFEAENFVDAVKRLTGGKGVDVVYDGVGAATFNDGLKCMRPRGLMVLFGAIGYDFVMIDCEHGPHEAEQRASAAQLRTGL